MEPEVKKDFSILFDFNPVLAIELSRIKAKTTSCVLLQQFFEEISISAREYIIRSLEAGNCNTRKVEKNVKSELKSQKEYELVRKLKCEVIPFAMILNRISKPSVAPEVYFYVCSQDKQKKIQKKISSMRNPELHALKKINLYGKNDSESLGDLTEFTVRINRVEGNLLAYPECCIKKFVNAREENKHHEREIALECLRDNRFRFALDSFINPHRINFFELPDEFYSFFTSNFYPCSVDCKKAINTGKKVESYLDDFGKAYRAKLVLNVMYQFAVCYGSYELIKKNNLEVNNEYRKTIVNYFDVLDSRLNNILNKTKNLVIYSGNELGNVYIRKVMSD
jgi:hypothetical protein